MDGNSHPLATFVRTRSAGAFKQLVDCHVNMVYAAARRQVQDPHDAEDITQAVFIVLAQKARTIQNAALLPAWLLKVTHFTAANARKAAARRRQHEEACAMPLHAATPAPDLEWDKLSPHLDAALSHLSDTDRALVIAHCIEQQSIAELAATLNMSEPAARKRVQRAVERLRTLLLPQTSLSAIALPALLAAHAVTAAPSALSATVIAVALTALNDASAGAGMTLANEVIRMLFWTKAKFIAATALVLSAIAVSLAAAVPHFLAQSTPAPTPALTLPAKAAAGAAATRPEPKDLHPGAAAGDHFAQKVQAALGIQDRGTDIVPTLQLALQQLKIDAAGVPQGGGGLPQLSANPVYDRLVQELLSGPHPTALVEGYLPKVAIGSATGNFPEFDRTGMQDYLVIAMWNRAKTLDATDAQKARDLARASLLLAAMSDFRFGWSQLAVAMGESDVARRLLALPNAQFNEIAALVRARTLQMSLTSFEVEASGSAIDAISAAKDAPVTLDQAKAILGHLDKNFRGGVPQLGDRFFIVELTWRFLNLAKLRQSLDAQEVIRKQLATWQHDFPDPDMERWITEALSREGPPPTPQFAYIVDGKTVTKQEFDAMTRPRTLPSTIP